MSEDLASIIPKLDREEIIPWLTEMKIGRPAYDLIRSALEGGTLTVFQTRNALHALFRLRSHANEQEVFDIYVRFAQHSNELIRSYAVQLGIGLLRLHREYPLQPLAASQQDLDTFRKATELGVEPHVAEVVLKFLTT